MADHARRECDLVAKDILRPRSSCVFFAPARGVLEHLENHQTASSWHKEQTGKGISCQTYNILHKVKSLDDWLRKDMERAQRVHEVHPELSFAHWNATGHEPPRILDGKKTREGHEQRVRLIDEQWPGAVDVATASLGPYASGSRRWQKDDLLDAFAALWTLQRIAAGKAICYPSNPSRDKCGLTMCIWA